MKKYKAAILGMGNMGRAHAGSMLKLEDVELAALCSYPKDDAEKYAAEHELSCRIYDDGFKMIEEEDLDILYICLPPFAHQGQLEAAAQKGINVFIEKPIALDVARGEAMAKAVKDNHVYSQVGYQMRFGGAVRRFKEMLDSKKAGKPTLYTANYECNSLHSPWWRDAAKCGGQVFEQVIHLYDMSLYLMGNPKEVSGFVANMCHQDVEGYTIEDTSISNIVYESGALGSISGSNCAVKNQWNGKFRIVCEKMVAEFTDQNHAVFIYTDGEEPRTEIVETDDDVTFLEDTYFLGVVKGENPPFADIEAGLTGLKMVAGVVESSKGNGKIVEIS